MKKQFVVTLTFLYDSEEDISDWSFETPFDKIETKEQAEEAAILELENYSPRVFEFKVEEF